MMSSNQEQLLLLWRCLGCGMCLYPAWMIAERIRRRIRSEFLRIVFDAAYMIVIGFCLFLFSLAVCGGEIRFAMIAAVAAGSYISCLSVGRVFSAVLSGLEHLFRAIGGFSAWLQRKVVDLRRKIVKKVELFYKKHLQKKHL